MSEAKWYVVHTYSGYEKKVKAVSYTHLDVYKRQAQRRIREKSLAGQVYVTSIHGVRRN